MMGDHWSNNSFGSPFDLLLLFLMDNGHARVATFFQSIFLYVVVHLPSCRRSFVLPFCDKNDIHSHPEFWRLQNKLELFSGLSADPAEHQLALACSVIFLFFHYLRQPQSVFYSFFLQFIPLLGRKWNTLLRFVMFQCRISLSSPTCCCGSDS
jgi:hypothetical protein